MSSQQTKGPACVERIRLQAGIANKTCACEGVTKLQGQIQPKERRRAEKGVGMGRCFSNPEAWRNSWVRQSGGKGHLVQVFLTMALGMLLGDNVPGRPGNKMRSGMDHEGPVALTLGERSPGLFGWSYISLPAPPLKKKRVYY